MKYIYLTLLLLGISGAVFAQKRDYILPADIETDEYSISFEKARSSSSSYYVNFTVVNKGNGHLFSNRAENRLLQNGGKAKPSTDKAVIKPGAKKLIYNEFRAKAPMKACGDFVELQIKGLQYAPTSPYFVNADPLTLGDGATQKVGNFSIKTMEYNVRTDYIFTELKVTYNGDHNHVGALDLEGVKVVDQEAKIVKKGDILKSGKSYTFSINIPSTSPSPVVDWGNAFQERVLTSINIPALTLNAVDFDAEAAVEVEAGTTATVEPPKPVEGCALSYTDFNTLKNDISSEANSGGNPVGLASEFMLNKGCLNTAQVVELLSVFNLDGQRLDFAKMAYKYTSDKPKFSQVVGKLSYNKNKEALEEFLSNQ